MKAEASLRAIVAGHRRTLLRAACWPVLGAGASSFGPLTVRIGIDRGIVDGSGEWVLTATIALAALSLVNGIATARETREMGTVGHDLMCDLRVRLVDHVFRLDPMSRGGRRTGELVSRLTSDVANLQQLLEGGASLVLRAGLLLVVSLVIMLRLSWQLTLVAVASTVPLLIATVVYRRYVLTAEVEVRDRIANLLSHVNESLVGMHVVQSFTIEDRRRHAFREVNGDTYRARMRTARASALYYPVVELVPAIALATVLAAGTHLAANGTIELGVVIAFALYVNHLLGPVQQLAEVMPVLQSAIASWKKIGELLEVRPEVVDPPTAVALAPGPGVVTMSGVSYRYPGQSDWALHKVDLTFVPGQRTVIVGHSGAGKTTVARMVRRYSDPCEGSVTIDGQDVSGLELDSLRRSVCLVPQEGYLFEGTVASNISIARPGATRDEIEDACRRLGVIDRLNTLPDGLDTMVTGGGRSLSAGQRQIVSLLRVVLVDPRVVILDEATSNVDPATELVLNRALDVLLADRTTIVIAHRPSTALRADRVVMLDSGSVVADGAPADLLANASAFVAWARPGRVVEA